MTDGASTTFEDDVIADMRAHDGAVTAGPLTGHPLLIMTSQGAKTGQPRRALLTWSRDGDDYVVAGTAGGAPKAPAWFHNVEANQEVSIEAGNQTFDAKATTLVDGAERERLWNQHVAALPWFAAYTEQTGRVIPMIRLTPVR
ncbi:MAG: nitroreductase family deazaflavin-dependent oxidoreductase [Chloroflexi bacterium]|nr:nitroreductase family deazaflavin-dependent oxidoreductase [Chloroflexota bacterium]